MKIAHVLIETAHGPLSYGDLASGGRGVTGSEQAMLYLAKAQAAAGHQVLCYMPTESAGFDGGVELLDVRTAWPRLRRMDGVDVAIAWLTADPLRQISDRVLRVHSLQINDWMLCGYGFNQFVDRYVMVSEAHRRHLWGEMGAPAEQDRLWAGR